MAAAARWCAAWLALCVAAGCVTNQTAQHVPSPLAIWEDVLRLDEFDAPALMRRLGLPEKLTDSRETFRCPRGRCSADVLPFTGATVLTLCTDFGTSCRVIAFGGTNLEHGSGKWRVLGFVDVAQKYGVDVQRIFPWLTIDRLQGAGTGILSYHRDWFTLTRTEFRKELTTVWEGHHMNVNPMRFWRGQMIEGPTPQGPQTVTFLYFIEFRDRRSEIKLFDERRLVKFTRQSPA